LQDIVIPEPKDAKTPAFQPNGPFLVSFSICRVLTAIDFNNQPTFHTKKIHNIGAKWHLLAKSRAVQLAASQVLPETDFRLSPILPQSLCC